jgi:hypothetical protein
MESPGLERLRLHLRRHNRRVLALTGATFVLAGVLWAGLFFVAWWLFILGGAASRPFDAMPAPGPLARGFATVALLLCAVAWIGRLLRPNEAARDHKGVGGHLLDLVLAVPRLTLSGFGTGSAAARLSETELEHAWNLLRRMEERGQPVRVTELPVEIPDAAMRGKIVLALQVSGLIEIRPSASGPVFAFHNAEARRLAQERVRLRY